MQPPDRTTRKFQFHSVRSEVTVDLNHGTHGPCVRYKSGFLSLMMATSLKYTAIYGDDDYNDDDSYNVSQYLRDCYELTYNNTNNTRRKIRKMMGGGCAGKWKKATLVNVITFRSFGKRSPTRNPRINSDNPEMIEKSDHQELCIMQEKFIEKSLQAFYNFE
uniref:Uncharacterized protein n=1 Tax=Romanomermis culicivorax TaxID=13658 RepID=A0A915IAR2_ROMCU